MIEIPGEVADDRSNERQEAGHVLIARHRCRIICSEARRPRHKSVGALNAATSAALAHNLEEAGLGQDRDMAIEGRGRDVRHALAELRCRQLLPGDGKHHPEADWMKQNL